MKHHLIIACSLFLFSTTLSAQTTTRTLTGNFGAGFAVTSGNADTRNFNISFNVLHDPKGRNLLKLTGLYLWGNSEGISNIDRTTVNIRDEFTLSPRVFFFGQNEYLRDKFKEIDYLISPTAGFGYKLINTDTAQLTIDNSLGSVWEKNTGRDVTTNGAYNAGERFAWKFSRTASITHNMTGLWELDDFHNALYTLGLGLAASITSNSELKVELLNSYKTRPPDVTIQKNDVAIITAFVFKF